MLMILAVGSLMNKLVMMTTISHVAFTVRLVQKLSEFEIRRVEADVRTITPNLIHRVTPRFKSLLHECHMIGNLSHGALYIILGGAIINGSQLMGAVMQASFSESSGEAGNSVPSWSFAVSVILRVDMMFVSFACMSHTLHFINSPFSSRSSR